MGVATSQLVLGNVTLNDEVGAASEVHFDVRERTQLVSMLDLQAGCSLDR